MNFLSIFLCQVFLPGIRPASGNSVTFDENYYWCTTKPFGEPNRSRLILSYFGQNGLPLLTTLSYKINHFFMHTIINSISWRILTNYGFSFMIVQLSLYNVKLSLFLIQEIKKGKKQTVVRDICDY